MFNTYKLSTRFSYSVLRLFNERLADTYKCVPTLAKHCTPYRCALVSLSTCHRPSVGSLTVRYKSTKRRKGSARASRDDEDDDEDDDDNDSDDDDVKLGKGEEIKTYTVPSLRIDSVLKRAFNLKRKTIEDYFYSDRLRLNGERFLKKSTNVSVDDEVDIIKNVSPDNKNYLTVSRLVVLNIKLTEEEDQFMVKVMKSKSLLTENYDSRNRWEDTSQVSES